MTALPPRRDAANYLNETVNDANHIGAIHRLRHGIVGGRANEPYRQKPQTYWANCPSPPGAAPGLK